MTIELSNLRAVFKNTPISRDGFVINFTEESVAQVFYNSMVSGHSGGECKEDVILSKSAARAAEGNSTPASSKLIADLLLKELSHDAGSSKLAAAFTSEGQGFSLINSQITLR